MEKIKVISPATVDEDVKKIMAEFDRRWARCWPSALRAIEGKFPPGFVREALNAYLQEGLVPDDPGILDVAKRIKYWRELEREAEANKRHAKTKAKKKASATRKGLLSRSQKPKRKR
jgi:hypothetical protein